MDDKIGNTMGDAMDDTLDGTMDDTMGGIMGTIQNSWFGDLLAIHWMVGAVITIVLIMLSFMLLGLLIRWMQAGFFLTYGVIFPIIFCLVSAIMFLGFGG